MVKCHNCGWASHIPHSNHWDLTLVTWKPVCYSSKIGSIWDTLLCIGYLDSSSPKVSWQVCYKITQESIPFPLMRSSLTSSFWKKSPSSNLKMAHMLMDFSCKVVDGIWTSWSWMSQNRRYSLPNVHTLFSDHPTTVKCQTTSITDAPCTRLQHVVVCWARLDILRTSSCGFACQATWMSITGSREVLRC